MKMIKCMLETFDCYSATIRSATLLMTYCCALPRISCIAPANSKWFLCHRLLPVVVQSWSLLFKSVLSCFMLLFIIIRFVQQHFTLPVEYKSFEWGWCVTKKSLCIIVADTEWKHVWECFSVIITSLVWCKNCMSSDAGSTDGTFNMLVDLPLWSWLNFLNIGLVVMKF